MPGDGLYAALLAVQAEMPTLPKNATNPHFKSKYTPLDTVVEVATPILSKHKLVWTTKPSVYADTGAPSLRYRLTHTPSGEFDDGEMLLLLPKSDPQGQGSAITYARRYAMQCVLGIVADEDVDGNMAPAERKAPPGKAAKPPLAPSGVVGINGPRRRGSQLKGLTAEETTRLMAKLDHVDPKKIQLALAARGVNDLPELTYEQGKSLLAEVTA